MIKTNNKTLFIQLSLNKVFYLKNENLNKDFYILFYKHFVRVSERKIPLFLINTWILFKSFILIYKSFLYKNLERIVFLFKYDFVFDLTFDKERQKYEHLKKKDWQVTVN